MSLFDSASLVVTPNGYKEDKLYAIKPDDGSGDLVVTRATTATRVNSVGLIEQVPYNLLTYSNTFSNGVWNKNQSSIDSNVVNNPFGIQDASKLKYNTVNNWHGILQEVSLTGKISCSVYAKQGELNLLQIASAQSVNEYANFNLQNGTLGANGSLATNVVIENVGNGWYRCSVTFTNGSNGMYLALINNINSDWFATSGYAGANNTNGIYIYGAQVENFATAKEYFPTTDRLDVPRLDYTGGSCPSILVEPQRTNVLTYSEQLNDASWAVNATITANTTISPDGTQNADTILGTGFIGKNILQSGIHTFSVFAKAGTSNEIRLNVFDGTTDRGVYYNLSNGTITSSYGTIIASNIVSYGNGWYRISITTNNATRSYVQIHRDSAQTCFIWGAQLEAGSYATSYIPTTSSSVTRNADDISKTGISDLIGQTEGTMFLDFDFNYSDSATQVLLKANQSNDSNSVGIEVQNNVLKAIINSSSSTIANLTNTISIGRIKCAISYKSNDMIFYVNGVQVGSDTGGSINFGGNVDMITLGHFNLLGTLYFQSSRPFNSAILWKERLTDQELATLTTI